MYKLSQLSGNISYVMITLTTRTVCTQFHTTTLAKEQNFLVLDVFDFT